MTALTQPRAGPVTGAFAHSVEPTRMTYLIRRASVGGVALVVLAAGLMVGGILPRPGSTTEIELTAPVQEAVVPTQPPPPTTAPQSVEQSLPTRSSRFVAQAPRRVLDTGDGRAPLPDTTYRVAVDADRTAVALSVSIIDSSKPGSIFVDGGAGIVEAITANQSGVTTTELVVVPLAGNGLTVRSSAGGNLVVDVVGSFEASGPTDVGRFVSVAPTDLSPPAAGSGAEITLPIGQLVPGGVSGAVLVAVTAEVGPDGGTVRIGPSQGRFDQALRWSGADVGTILRRGLVVLQPGPDGTARLRPDGASVLSAEVIGYFSGGGGEPSVDGLYAPSGPRLLVDGPATTGQSLTIAGLDPSAATALITISSPSVGVGSLGSVLVPVMGGEGTVQPPAGDAEVVLLGLFLAASGP